MSFDSLINAKQLFRNLNNPDWVIIDCHFELDAPDAGWEAYQKYHIPGAIYAHLDHDLAGPIIPGKTGRHPLPEIEAFSKTLSHWGIDESVQVVVYDNRGGGFAARLWWMLKWLGHNQVALLDGGLANWKESGYPLEAPITEQTPRNFQPAPQPQMVANLPEIQENLYQQYMLVDSRAPERYLGEAEPIDPVAGHIPGAINADYMDNLDQNQFFLDKEILTEKFSRLVGDKPAEKVVFYCGSGVTSAHNVLAMYHAGLGLAKLYPGSWSEWIADPNRPIEKGTSTTIV